MKLEKIFNEHFIEELNRSGKKIKIEINLINPEEIFITAGIYIRTRHKKSALLAIYADLKDKCPEVATTIMALIFGSKT